MSNGATGRVYWRADQTDEQGHLTQQTYANGVATTRSWDLMGRLVSSAAGTGNAVHNDSYGYDSLGNQLVAGWSGERHVPCRGVPRFRGEMFRSKSEHQIADLVQQRPLTKPPTPADDDLKPILQATAMS